MKKFLSFVMVACAVAFVGLTGLVAVGCGDGKTPGAAAKKMMQWAANGNYERFADGLYVSPELSEAQAGEYRASVVEFLIGQRDATFAIKGELRSVEIVSETMGEDGDAEVVFTLTYAGGDRQTETATMVRADGGWKLVI